MALLPTRKGTYTVARTLPRIVALNGNTSRWAIGGRNVQTSGKAAMQAIALS